MTPEPRRPTPAPRPATTLLFALLLAAALPLNAIAEATATPASRFVTVGIVVDSGKDDLAAYQVEVVTTGTAQFVGVAGGEHPAYAAPPYFDPAAIRSGNRVIVAAFSRDTNLPTGATKVAELQVREVGPVTYTARLMAAARPDLSRFTPTVRLVVGGQQ